MAGSIIDDCAPNFNMDAYFYMFVMGTIGWGLCLFVNLPLLIVYWVCYKGRGRAEYELINYKFAEQRDVLKIPPELNSQSTFTPIAGPSNASITSPGIVRDDPFINSPPITYRPPTFPVNREPKDRWQQVKK